MGTLLLARGVGTEVCLESLNLSDKALIESVHRDYIRAGARIIGTNTYAANRFQLAPWGLEDQVWSINVWGVKIARQAREVSGQPVLVGGAMGPLGRKLEPVGGLTRAQARNAYVEQVEALLAGGVDFFLVETSADVEEAVVALEAVRSLCRLPVAVQFSFTPEMATPAGQGPEAIMKRLGALEQKPDIVGLNCGAGPQVLLDVLRQMRRASTFAPVWSVFPNAGMPVKVGHRHSYHAIPDYFARAATALVEAGADIVGGCCGTTPEHIRAMADALAARQSEGTADGPGAFSDEHPGVFGAVLRGKPESAVVESGRFSGGLSAGSGTGGGNAGDSSMAEHRAGRDDLEISSSRLASRLGNEFVISVELDPPRGTVINRFVRGARSFKEAGVDTVNVADSPMARVRMASVAGAHLLTREADIETIIHFTTRDRNLMGIQADLLGAHALGIRNVLALTGDPPALGNVTHATPVYDVDAIGLIHILNDLNNGVDVAGNSIGEPTNFTIGCAMSPNAENFNLEVERFRKKIAAGVHFTMTQPLYEPEPLHRFLDATGGCPVPILLGVMPLHSFKQAEYLHNEVPGITIPDRVRAELEAAGDDGLRVGLEQAAALIEELKQLIGGIYVVGSFGKHEAVAEFVRRLRKDGWI